MILDNEIALANTKNKLKLLKERYEEIAKDTDEDSYIQELTLHSLKKMINQLTEEIARYEAHAGGVK